MIQNIILKLTFEKTTFKLADVEVYSLKQLTELFKGKFGDKFENCVFNAKYDDRTEMLESDADVLKAVKLAVPNKKGQKVLSIKVTQNSSKVESEQQKPVENTEKLTKEIQGCIDINWNYMKKRVKAQYDLVNEEGCKMYGVSDTPICFSDGSYKLSTRMNEDSYDAILDSPENIACNWFFDFYDGKKKTQKPAVLNIYADYSVQLWTDPEDNLLAWGWIKPVDKSTISIFLNFEEYDTEEPIKLTLQQDLVKETNQIDGTEFYVVKSNAPFGIIPHTSFAIPMKADGLFFARNRNRGKHTTVKGTVMHPSIHKAGEFSTIVCNKTKNCYVRFACQFGQEESENPCKAVQLCWKNWNMLTQSQKGELKDKSKKNAIEKCKKYGGMEFDKDHPFQNFNKLIHNKVTNDKKFRGKKDMIFKLFLEMKDDISELLDRKIQEIGGSDDEFVKIDSSCDKNEKNSRNSSKESKESKNWVKVLNNVSKRKLQINSDEETEDWQKYSNPKKWMAKEWNDVKHEKWLSLIKLYPKVAPWKIGSLIKTCPNANVEVLKVKIDYILAENSENFGTHYPNFDRKRFSNAKPWMCSNWNDAKHEKWLSLIKEYPKVAPWKIGSLIKNCPNSTVEELKEKINHILATKSDDWNIKDFEKFESVAMKNTVEEWKKYEHAKKWMTKDWNEAKQEKWLTLCQDYQFIAPWKLGKAIKGHPNATIYDLKEKINHRLIQKSKKFKLNEKENETYSMISAIFPDMPSYFIGKAIFENREKKASLDDVVSICLAKYEQKKDKYRLQKDTPKPKK